MIPEEEPKASGDARGEEHQMPDAADVDAQKEEELRLQSKKLQL